MSGAYQVPSTFTDNVGQYLSASALNKIRSNMALVDHLSFRPMPTFDSSGYNDAPTPGNYPTGGTRVWDGYLPPMESGMTDLVVEGTASGMGSGQIRITLDGVQQGTTFAPSAQWSRTISVSGRAAGSVGYLEVFLTGSYPASAGVVVVDAYVTPVPATSLGSYPGEPTFAAQWQASKATQLANAAAWLFRRMALVPLVGQRLLTYQIGNFRPGESPLYYGGVLKSQSNDILRIYGILINSSATGVHLRVKLNGTNYDDDVYGTGTSYISLPVPLSSVSVGSRAAFGLFSNVTDAGAQANWKHLRWSFTAIRTEADAAGYSYATLPTEFVQGSLAASLITSRLNSLASIAATVKARIDNAPHVWNRVRCMRRHYDKYPYQGGLFIPRARPTFLRRGSRLVVRGQDVQVAWGALALPTDPAKADVSKYADEYTPAHTERVIEANKVETSTLQLDSVKDLTRTTLYRLMGDVQWAGSICNERPRQESHPTSYQRAGSAQRWY